MIGRPRPALCLVTDRRRLAPDARTPRDEFRALDEQLADAIAAGVDLIQIRERDLEAGVLCGLVRGWVARAHGHPVAIIVNDRADVVLASRAAGVHLRSDGPPVDRVRGLGPAGWIVGRSIHTAAEAAAYAGADYLVFGAVFSTESKPAGTPAIGVQGLRAAVGVGSAPILAIGGVEPANAAACIAAGARGVAAIGAFLPEGRGRGALGVARAVKEFRDAMAT